MLVRIKIVKRNFSSMNTPPFELKYMACKNKKLSARILIDRIRDKRGAISGCYLSRSLGEEQQLNTTFSFFLIFCILIHESHST